MSRHEIFHQAIDKGAILETTFIHPPMPEVTGQASFTVGDETYKTWYKVVGDLKSGKTPLVILHGGPGMAHYYLLPLTKLHDILGIPIIFYDQVGAGQSTHLSHKPDEFWTIDLFMDELQNLLTHLGITEYDLLGHSWGSTLATEFASRRRPPGLRRIVFSNPVACMLLFVEGNRKLCEGLPESVQEVLNRHHREGNIDTVEYREALGEFHKRHVCRLDPIPEPLLKSMEEIEKNPRLHTVMVGTSELYPTGKLKTWSMLDRIPSITQSCLVISAEYDEAQDICVAPYFELLQKVKWYHFEDSSHVPHLEKPDRYIEIVSKFLGSP